MKRKTFISLLKKELSRRNDIEVEEVVFYYDELIQDAIDAGEDESTFIESLGEIKEIVRRIEDDETFIVEVKAHNQNVLKKTIHVSTKIFVYFFLGVFGFVIAVAGISIFASGVALIGSAVIKIVTLSDLDVFGYFAYLAISVIGVSFILFSIALIRWHFTSFRESLLALLRKTNNFLSKRG